MARRARKPLLPQLLWGPQKRNYRRMNQVTVVRVPAAGTSPRLMEDFVVSSVLGMVLTITAILLTN